MTCQKIASGVPEILLKSVFNKYASIKEVAGNNLVENKPSQRILLKLGFKFKMKKINRNGAVVNNFVLTREDFENRKNQQLNIDKELEFIENYPASDEVVESYIL